MQPPPGGPKLRACTNKSTTTQTLPASVQAGKTRRGTAKLLCAAAAVATIHHSIRCEYEHTTVDMHKCSKRSRLLSNRNRRRLRGYTARKYHEFTSRAYHLGGFVLVFSTPEAQSRAVVAGCLPANKLCTKADYSREAQERLTRRHANSPNQDNNLQWLNTDCGAGSSYKTQDQSIERTTQNLPLI